MRKLSYFPIYFLSFLIAGSSAYGTDLSEYPHEFEPDPYRFISQIEKLTQDDETSPPPPGAIVCTGSSSMRMWHPRIEADMGGLTLIPRGFGGSHYSDAIYFAERLILKYKPRAVLIYEGDNDINDGKNPQRVLEDLVFLVERCRMELPDLRFYVISGKPSLARVAVWPQMQEANALMEDYCNSTAGMTFIDLGPALLTAEGTPKPDIFIADNLHLNAKGYDLWASVIVPVMTASEAAYESPTCCKNAQPDSPDRTPSKGK